MTDDLWETHARWWIDGFTDGADPEYEEQILPLAADALNGARTVLDVGCGDGQVARLAVKGGATKVIGLDPTWNQIVVAHQRDGGAHFLQAGAANLPFRDEAFDAVVACLVFEHIRDVDDAIAEVARVLKFADVGKGKRGDVMRVHEKLMPELCELFKVGVTADEEDTERAE